jgi:hypothetical protein
VQTNIMTVFQQANSGGVFLSIFDLAHCGFRNRGPQSFHLRAARITEIQAVPAPGPLNNQRKANFREK